MTLESLLSFLAIFLLLSGAAMWLVYRQIGLFGCLLDWAMAAGLAGAGCLGLWINNAGVAQGSASLEVWLTASLSAVFYVAAGYVMRGAIRFADGRDLPVLNRAVRWQYPVSALMAVVHISLALLAGKVNGAFLSIGLTTFALFSSVALLRTIELAQTTQWLKPSLRCLTAAMSAMTAVAGTMALALTGNLGSWFEALEVSIYALTAILFIVLVYAMFWIVAVLHRKRQQDRDSEDELTGVLNRNGVQHAVRRHFTGPRPKPVIVLQIDVDHFNRVNDEHGRDTGDRMLREIARALRTSCRDTDFVARTGGEEFTVVCVGADPHSALELAERMRKRIGSTEVHQAQGQPVSCSVSIGLSGQCPGMSRWSEAWHQADNALFRAKSLGCNICISHQTYGP